MLGRTRSINPIWTDRADRKMMSSPSICSGRSCLGYCIRAISIPISIKVVLKDLFFVPKFLEDKSVSVMILPVVVSEVYWPLLVIMSINFCSLHRIVPMSKFMRMVVSCRRGRCIRCCATSQITTSASFILRLMMAAYSKVFREFFT